MSELTTSAREAWNQAARDAAGTGCPEIEPIHIVHAILSLVERGGAETTPEWSQLRESLSRAQVELAKLRAAIRSMLPSGRTAIVGQTIHRSTETRELFERAIGLSRGLPASATHLFAASLEHPNRTLRKALGRGGSKADTIRGCLVFPEQSAPRPAQESVDSPQQSLSAPQDAEETSALESFGKDLTQAAREGRIPPIIGRRTEILQTLQALSRKKKNNPVLVGDAGVGKTAIVEALALRAVQGKDPQVLGGKRIVEVDMGSLLSGTTLRGQFEERLTSLIEEASQDENLILFIDEIHTIMGAGGGAQDAAQLLKPAMSRGAIKLIGATTLDEYRRYIEKDPAMERRFEKIIVDEPSREEAVEMLLGLRSSLAKHHGTLFEDEAVEAAVDLSMRIDVDHRLPDKAIDLLDRAGARAKVSELSMYPVRFGGQPTDGPESGSWVSPKDIAEVLAEKMGMPAEIVAGHLEAQGARRILELEEFLLQSIKGQEHAVSAVSQRMILAHASVMDRRGPMSTLLFLGPSGVGKTELAKQMGLFLFGSDKNLIRLDMSEFKEEHSISKLIGSPPGYVGSDQEGQLTGQIRRKPYSIVLLDEVEKAHPRIYDVFLQVFDEGRLTDSKGRLADARNCIFVLTTNVRPDADPNDRTAINTALKTWFRPELINRIDEIISFNHLSRESIEQILKGHLAELREVLWKRHGVELSTSDEALTMLASEGYNPEYGARELRRTLERRVQVPLSTLVLSGDLGAHPTWRLAVLDGQIAFIRA